MLRIVLLALALAAGGVAAWLAVSFVGEDAPATVVSAPAAPSQEVLVAASNLAQGDKLDAAKLRWHAWPENAVNAAFILRSVRPDAIETLSGTVVSARFISSEPILEEKLARAEASFLSALLPSGMRAVALRVSAENTAGGFILPNDRVDVLHTISTAEDGSGAGGAVTRTILRNVRVLAIDQTALMVATEETDKQNDSGAVVGKTATLELGSNQTETITAAQANGTLSLSLRSVADNDEARGVIFKEPQKVKEPEKLDTSRTIRIVRAGKSEFITFQ